MHIRNGDYGISKIHNHEVAGSIPAPATIKEISKLRHGSLLIFVCVPLELFHGEGEVGVREGLVFEGEVPPLAVEGLESVAEHRLTQDHTVGELLWGDATACGTLAVVARIFTRLGIAAEVWMAFWSEPVEGAAISSSFSVVISKRVRSTVEPRVWPLFS